LNLGFQCLSTSINFGLDVKAKNIDVEFSVLSQKMEYLSTSY